MNPNTKIIPESEKSLFGKYLEMAVKPGDVKSKGNQMEEIAKLLSKDGGVIDKAIQKAGKKMDYDGDNNVNVGISYGTIKTALGSVLFNALENMSYKDMHSVATKIAKIYKEQGWKRVDFHIDGNGHLTGELSE